LHIPKDLPGFPLIDTRTTAVGAFAQCLLPAVNRLIAPASQPTLCWYWALSIPNARILKRQTSG